MPIPYTAGSSGEDLASIQLVWNAIGKAAAARAAAASAAPSVRSAEAAADVVLSGTNQTIVTLGPIVYPRTIPTIVHATFQGQSTNGGDAGQLFAQVLLDGASTGKAGAQSEIDINGPAEALPFGRITLHFEIDIPAGSHTLVLQASQSGGLANMVAKHLAPGCNLMLLALGSPLA